MRDFTQVVKENVGEYGGWFSGMVKWAPIFAATLMVLSHDPRLPTRHRSSVNAALAYFVSPDDAVSEQDNGPYGYLDDNLVSAYVLERIALDVGWKVVEDAWQGDLEARQVIRETLDREQELLGHLGEEALQAAGVLDERGRRRADVADSDRPYGLS